MKRQILDWIVPIIPMSYGTAKIGANSNGFRLVNQNDYAYARLFLPPPIRGRIRVEFWLEGSGNATKTIRCDAYYNNAGSTLVDQVSQSTTITATPLSQTFDLTLKNPAFAMWTIGLIATEALTVNLDVFGFQITPL